MEPKNASDVDRVLNLYSQTIKGQPVRARKVSDESDTYFLIQSAGFTSGAILLAVVGAKLSEGINFADDLARAVIMVGMPFANMTSPELAERMKYVPSFSRVKLNLLCVAMFEPYLATPQEVLMQ